MVAITPVIVRRDGFALQMPDTHGRFAFVPLRDLPHPRVLVEVLRMRSRVVLEGPRLLGLAGD